MSSDVYESFINTIRAEAVSQTIEDLTVKLVRTRLELDAARATIDEALAFIDETLSANEGNSGAVVWRNDEVIAMLTDLRSRFVIPVQVRAETYRISYQKYLMATPGNFASVRGAVEDAWLADPTLNSYQKEQNDEQ